MTYTRVSFLIAPVDPWRDILMVELGELGYDSYEETTGGLEAYIGTAEFDAVAVSKLMTLRDPHVHVSWSHAEMPNRNWNAEWEQSFVPVEVDGRVRVRAEHHAPDPAFAHELVITPRMAFGTGHHATTRMMVRAMLGLDLEGKAVCDLGCGTAVLAMLAERLGATTIMAIDNDEVAVSNAQENVVRNGCHVTVVEKGDADSLRGHTYDTILANIERNTLLKAMPVMAAALKPGGALLLSGFVLQDRHHLEAAAVANGLVLAERLEEGEWSLLGCRVPAEPSEA
ncbi:MAG: 50S ribosomal protein L11 methyltransferase [Flavobacteriales bacterium]